MKRNHELDQDGKRMDKRPYAPPQLRSIELVTDEVLSKNCKTETNPEKPCDLGAGQTEDFGS